jgi:hypothetical protein
VSDSFRKVVANFKKVEMETTPINGRRIEAITRIASEILPPEAQRFSRSGKQQFPSDAPIVRIKTKETA